jgi:hypothetical protein
MNNIRFTCTALSGKNKLGNLTADKDGYRDMVVGGLNMFNSAGQWYDYEGAKALFESSSTFMRRVSRGALRGEVGHPRQLPGQTDEKFIARVLDIDETNVCVHFKEIYLDFDKLKSADGKPVIAIMAKLKPSGDKADFLEKQLNNKDENVCFSIRSFTKDYYNRGVYTRELKNIVTFDYVNEPGISIANKYQAPGLESLTDKPLTNASINKAVTQARSGIGTESSIMNANELFQSLGWDTPKSSQPGFSNW